MSDGESRVKPKEKKKKTALAICALAFNDQIGCSRLRLVQVSGVDRSVALGEVASQTRKVASSRRLVSYPDVPYCALPGWLTT